MLYTLLLRFFSTFTSIDDSGPPHHPDDRPYVERFFGTVASTLSARLPGYTGSNPKDLRRALADPKGRQTTPCYEKESDQFENLMELILFDLCSQIYALFDNHSQIRQTEQKMPGMLAEEVTITT